MDSEKGEIPKLYIKSTNHLEELLIKSASMNMLVSVNKILAERIPINSRDQTGRTALHRAAEKGHFDIVKTLLANKADVNCCDGNNVEPLHLAVHNKHLRTVQLLLLAGADFQKRTLNDLEPIDYAEYNSEIWKCLQEAKDNELPDPNLVMRIPDIPFVPKYSVPQRVITPEDIKKKLMLQERQKKNKKKPAK